MPDSVAPVPAVPATEGTPLWNIQTQSPEWIPLAQVKHKLAAGTHRSYAGSAVPVAAGIGGEGALEPGLAESAVAGGATVTHSESARDALARDAALKNSYDNAGDKALAMVDGLVSGLSGNLVDGLPTGAYGKIEKEKRQEYHPGYNTLGELASLAAVAVAPESLLKFTPLGATNKLFSATAAATDAALVGKVGSGVLRKGISEAVGGAVASGALSSANAVSQAVQGQPVSGYALLDDIGLGAAIGGGLGSIGEALAGSARKSANMAKEIQAAARFDETAAPVRGTLVDASKAWHSAHNVAGARVEALDDLVGSGMLDADMPGTEWLKTRKAANEAADKARSTLHKLAGTEDPVAVGERLHDLAISGKAKEAQKLYNAFGEYGNRVSILDDAMQPTTFDNAHLGDVIGDIDLSMPAKDHPMQRLQQMIENGTPADEIERFANQIDENYNKARGDKGDIASRETVQPGNKTGDLRNGRQTPEKSEPAPAKKHDLRGESGQFRQPDTTWKPVKPLGEDINAPHSDEDLARSTLLGGSHAGNEEAGFQAKKIIDQARVDRAAGVIAPVRPTELGNNIQALMDQLTAATGNRLGSVEARALANSLGMNTASMTGPVASKLADLWSLHRMSESLAEQVGKGVKGSKTALTKALSWGVVSGAGHVGYETGGAMGGGIARSLARQALGTALYGAAAVTAVAGRFRQSAVNGLAKALNPTGRRAVGLAAITKVISSTYEPNKPPTTNYETKANQLQWLAQNPEPTETHLKKVFKDIGAVDPVAYTATVDAAMTRLQNLAKALPSSANSISMMASHRGPTEAQIGEWHQYEAVTSDRELVFKYLKAGYMPKAVVSAMNEQHPDFMKEVRDYVLNNPDEVKSSSHNTQMALSTLLGVPIVPEADPAYVKRMQEPYIEAKQKAAQAKVQAQGAGAIHPMQPTAAQLLVISR